MGLLNKFFNIARARTVELRQSADDGTDRIVVVKADGTEMAEIFSDGTNTVINPLSGNVDVQGALATDKGTFNDASADPSSNGEIQRNGSDVKIYSGGGVRNITNLTSILTLTKDDSPTLESQSGLTIGSDSWGTIFSKSAGSEVDILYGAVYGHSGAALRYTWDDGTTTTVGGLADFKHGESSGADKISSFPVGPAEQVRKLEAYNTDSGSGEFGAFVVTV